MRRLGFRAFCIFQQLIQRLNEILYLSRNRLLRKKKKKIRENHEKSITKSISVNNNKLAIVNDNFCNNPRQPDGVQTEDEEVERFEKMAGSVSQYSSARESLHSEYMAVPDRSLSPEISEYEITKSVQKSRSYLGDLPRLVVSSNRCIMSRKPSCPETGSRVPITFSWPSLEGQVSVHNPSIDSNTSNTGEAGARLTCGNKGGGGAGAGNIHRISSACDSGYSELDIYSTAGTLAAVQSEPGKTILRETSEANTERIKKTTSDNVIQNKLDISYMEELQIYFNLDKMFDKASHEENCFRELELSICSEGSKDGSCSEYSCSLPTKTSNLFCHQSSGDSFASANSNSVTTNNQAVISLAQLCSTNTIKNLHEHNVSKKYLKSLKNKQQASHLDKVIGKASMIPADHRRAILAREDSSRSLPITNQQQGSDDKEGSLSNMRRLSLPKVTQLGDDVILVEQSKRSREIFI